MTTKKSPIAAPIQMPADIYASRVNKIIIVTDLDSNLAWIEYYTVLDLESWVSKNDPRSILLGIAYYGTGKNYLCPHCSMPANDGNLMCDCEFYFPDFFRLFDHLTRYVDDHINHIEIVRYQWNYVNCNKKNKVKPIRI